MKIKTIFAAMMAAVVAAASDEPAAPRDWGDSPWPIAADGPRFRKSYVCVDVTNPYTGQKSERNGLYEYAAGLCLHLHNGVDGKIHLSRRTSLSGGRHHLHGRNPISSAAIADFGAIEPGQGAAGVSPADLNWTSLSVEIEAKGREPAMELTISRLTPALLIRPGGNNLRLFGGQKLNTQKSGKEAIGWAPSLAVPGFVAIGNGDDVAVVRAGPPEPGAENAGLPSLPLEYLDREQGWMLAWYGKNSVYYSCTNAFNIENLYPADSPFLILFENGPVDVRHAGDAIEFEFMEAAGNVAIIPLLGERYPPAVETEKWADGIPLEIVALCGWWTEHLREFPAGAVETYSYDKASDTATIRNEFEFMRLKPGGKRFLPLPPMTALAAECGFPVKVKGDITDSGLVTAFGPYRGIVSDADSLEYSVSGLDRYAAFPAPGSGGLPENKKYLQKLLGEQVEAILTAGHLAPYWPVVNDFAHCHGRKWSERLCWGIPAETHYFLAQALPFLDPAQAGRVREYLVKEKAAYPPHMTIHLPAEEGAMRTWHRMDASFYPYELPEKEKNFHYLYRLLPAETLHQMSFYYRDVAPSELAADFPHFRNTVAGWRFHSDWVTGGWFFWEKKIRGFSVSNVTYIDPKYGHGGVADANQWLAATIGYARMADMLDDESSRAEARGLLARAAILRFGMEKIGAFLAEKGIVALDTITPIAQMDELGFTRRESLRAFDERWLAFQGLTPEIAAFLRDYSPERLKAQLEDYTQFNPGWYMDMARSRHVVSESHHVFPEDVYYAFVAQAVAGGADAEQLERWLDAPWTRVGDYYFLAKLALAMRAYSGE